MCSSDLEVIWFGGEIGPEFSPGASFAAASFDTKSNAEIQAMAFGDGDAVQVKTLMSSVVAEIRESFERFLSLESIDSVIVQNAWAIPMHLPLAVAVADVVRDRAIPAIGHHHDFAWERPRFSACVVPEVLERSEEHTSELQSH